MKTMKTMGKDDYNSVIDYEKKSYEDLKERVVEWLIFDSTNKYFGCLRNDYTKYRGKCEAYALLFGDEEYNSIVEEVKRRTAELGLEVQEPKC